jgi:hypothetical protein
MKLWPPVVQDRENAMENVGRAGPNGNPQVESSWERYKKHVEASDSGNPTLTTLR